MNRLVMLAHRRQPRRGCRGRIPTNIFVGGDINGNVPTNIRGGNVVEYELLIAIVDDTYRIGKWRLSNSVTIKLKWSVDSALI